MRTILIVIIIFLVCQLILCLYSKENYNLQQITGHFGGVPSQANIDPCQTVGYGYPNKGCTSFDNELPQSNESYMEMMKHEPYSEKYMEMMKHKKHPNANPSSSKKKSELVEKFGDGYGKKCKHCHPNEEPYFELENMRGNDLINFYAVNEWPANDTPCASCSCNKNL